MNKDTPRLRMFAGPNGSGKSTLKAMLRPELIGIYINPDEIEKNIYTFSGPKNCLNQPPRSGPFYDVDVNAYFAIITPV